MRPKLVIATLLAAPFALPSGAATTPQQPSTPASGAASRFVRPAPPASHATALVDLNRASKEELMTLPGIGDTEARRIIAARPLGSKGWLVSKKILPEDKALGIRHLVFVGGAIKPATRKPSSPKSS